MVSRAKKMLEEPLNAPERKQEFVVKKNEKTVYKQESSSDA